MEQPLGSTAPQGLSRSLGLWDLVFIGLIMVQPTAPMPGFGAFYQQSNGHVVTVVLIAMVAMLFTAVSYGRMARVYPSAGSAYAYVGEELHPALGFATGWSMLLDYILNPLICVIWSARACVYFAPAIPYPLWVLFFAGLFTWFNLRKIQATARINTALVAIMGVVIAAMLVCTVRHLAGLPSLNVFLFTRPFYDPARFSLQAISGGTSIAVLTYLGFDGISTLSEESKNPRKHILQAMVLTCLITGALAAVEVYAAQLLWPAGKLFPSLETAYVEVSKIAGGPALALIVGLTLVVATVGSGAGAQLSGARLLFGMGRSQALPGRFFAKVNPRSRVPANNVILIGVLSLIGAFLISYEEGAELLNFGALLGFMGVNMSAFFRYCLRNPNRTLWDAINPLLGFVICTGIWWSLVPRTKVIGFIWLAVGLLYGYWRTQGFRNTVAFEAVPEA